VKLLFDKVVAAILLITLMPLLVVIALSIWIFLGRPVLFKQQRPGLNGKPFTLYKFRTMKDVVSLAGECLPDSERLTGLGIFLRATSLDELPELLNVLLGDMSLVGPRPLLLEYLPLYSPEQFRRHEVRPGITGWAQINGRNAVSWDERFKMDLWYVDNRSFRLDLKILWITALKVIKREGISQEGHATMPKFTGSEGGKS
jgi:lipopolysaccharide/colanic/teichoic acid biosynthesis glycosyltransferase